MKSLITGEAGFIGSHLTDPLESRILNGDKVNIFPIHEYWIDIGEKDNFTKLKMILLMKQYDQ